jgi:hypothetical protein
VSFDVGGAVFAPPALPAIERIPTSSGLPASEYLYPPGFFVPEVFPPEFFPPETLVGPPQNLNSEQPASPNTEVPEPSSVLGLLIGLGVLVAINEGKRQAMSNRQRPRDWPEGPRPIEPLIQGDDLTPSRGVAMAIVLGTAFWIAVIVAALFFLPAWKMGLL